MRHFLLVFYSKKFYFYLLFYSLCLFWAIALTILFPEILFVTDFETYNLMWTTDFEDTGFYPIFIFLRELFLIFSLPYSFFQVFSASLYIFSNLTLAASSGKSKSITIFVTLLICLFSFPLIKSFSLVKSFLSLSCFNLACLLYWNGFFRNKLFFILPIFASPIALPLVLTQVTEYPCKIRSYILNIPANLRSKLKIKFISLPKGTFLNLFYMFLCMTIFLLVFLRAPLFALSDPLANLTAFFLGKFYYYFNPALTLIAIITVFFFFVVFPRLCFPVAIVLSMLVMGYQRTSILIPTFCLLFIKNQPSFRIYGLLLLITYSTYNVFKISSLFPVIF